MKELREYNAIINSPFSQELSNLNYDNIDTEFLENLNEFIDSIMALSPDIQKNNNIIEKLKNSKGKSNNTQITLDNNSSEIPNIINNIQKNNGNDIDHKNIQEHSQEIDDDKRTKNDTMDIPKIDNHITPNKLKDNVSSIELNNNIINNCQTEIKTKEANDNCINAIKDNISLKEVNFENISNNDAIIPEEDNRNKCNPEDPNRKVMKQLRIKSLKAKL